MSEPVANFFVIAAQIAAKLDHANKVAQQLSLTASNARAVALRAGEGAAGFRPLTDFIDQLADLTVNSSQKINLLAASLSKTAADNFRAGNALARFKEVYRRAGNADHIDSLDDSLLRTEQRLERLERQYQQQMTCLIEELEILQGELRTAVILATLSRVEASQAGPLFQDALNNVADNVQQAAAVIKQQIKSSHQLVASLI